MQGPFHRKDRSTTPNNDPSSLSPKTHNAHLHCFNCTCLGVVPRALQKTRLRHLHRRLQPIGLIGIGGGGCSDRDTSWGITLVGLGTRSACQDPAGQFMIASSGNGNSSGFSSFANAQRSLTTRGYVGSDPNRLDSLVMKAKQSNGDHE